MIDKLIKVPYDDFRLMETIDPEQFDANNEALVDKIDEVIDYANALIDTTDGASGADKIGATPIPGVDGDTVQEILEGLKLAIQVAQLGQIVDGSITDAKLASTIKIGALTDLLTTAKTSVVAAINELKSAIPTNYVSTSDVTTVATANKILKLNDDGKLPANITGDANTLNGKDSTAFLEKSGGTMSGELNCADNLLTRAYLKDYAEVRGTTPATTGTVTLDLTTGNTFNITPTGNVTFAFTNPPANNRIGSFTLIINNGATVYSKTFPSSVKWDNDTIPDMSTVNKTIILTFVTQNAGTRWYGMSAGTNFTT